MNDEFRRAVEIEANTPITAGRDLRPLEPDPMVWGKRDFLIFACIVIFGIGIPVGVAVLMQFLQ